MYPFEIFSNAFSGGEIERGRGIGPWSNIVGEGNEAGTTLHPDLCTIFRTIHPCNSQRNITRTAEMLGVCIVDSSINFDSWFLYRVGETGASGRFRHYERGWENNCCQWLLRTWSAWRVQKRSEQANEIISYFWQCQLNSIIIMLLGNVNLTQFFHNC